jgi:hypothetical protein
MNEKQSVKDHLMWYDTDALIDYMNASERRRFELYLQFPKLRYLFDEIESDSIVFERSGPAKLEPWLQPM